MNKWTEEIDKITGRFVNSFSMLSEKDLNWKPSPKVWSIAENIDHLITLNETYFPGFSKLKKGTYQLPFISRFGFVVNFFGNMILKSVQPDNLKKTKTFPIWRPKKSEFSKNILNRFEEHQKRLKEEIEKIEDKVKENAVISSPANKNIVYRLETAFDILVAHEKRHYLQAENVYKLLKTEKS
ncbi:DinB family protein [Gramella lutea]|uniref:DinB family protein n=1 Tax=Christiangramia lutea TaxID=1607951 RepID=A0A9X1V027_9FLAO|nr:DinB family protein [Christiangramia lutea]MCH4821670.1 DinB family protein [Christiangramia lutea]